MTSFQVRADPGQADAGADFLLDWFDDKPASTVQYSAEFLQGLAPSPVARDLLRLGGAVFCADKLALREITPDFWTRELSVSVPVSDVALWNGAAPRLVEALNFLSGDRWGVEFTADPTDVPMAERIDDHDAVSLFSGGLDSLAGVIDLLEEGRRLVVVGHHESSLADSTQSRIFRKLSDHFGADKVQHHRLLLRPAAACPSPARALPREREITTRCRSFLFIAAGVAVADAHGVTVPLYVPENGYIGINVPLTGARVASLSTRTTHPLFMYLMDELLSAVGLSNDVRNPFRLSTKGEALAQSANAPLLHELAGESISCSHPEHARLMHLPQGNCGACYPCLIRRASMYRIGLDTADDYSRDVLTEPKFLGADWDSGASLRALITSLGLPTRPLDVVRNGRIPGGEAPAFYEMYQRGRAELRDWLLDGAGPELRQRLEAE